MSSCSLNIFRYLVDFCPKFKYSYQHHYSSLWNLHALETEQVARREFKSWQCRILYPIIKSTITRDPFGFTEYIWLDTNIVLKKNEIGKRPPKV